MTAPRITTSTLIDPLCSVRDPGSSNPGRFRYYIRPGCDASTDRVICAVGGWMGARYRGSFLCSYARFRVDAEHVFTSVEPCRGI